MTIADASDLEQTKDDMTIYYVTQFGLYYAGRAPDGTIKFANARSGAVALKTRTAADAMCLEMGGETAEVEERTLGATP